MERERSRDLQIKQLSETEMDSRIEVRDPSQKYVGAQERRPASRSGDSKLLRRDESNCTSPFQRCSVALLHALLRS